MTWLEISQFSVFLQHTIKLEVTYNYVGVSSPSCFFLKWVRFFFAANSASILLCSSSAAFVCISSTSSRNYKRREKKKRNWASAQQNQQNDLCTQRRLRSAWASAQSDWSFRCPPEEALGPWLPSTQRRLIRVGRSPGWSDFSLGVLVVLWFCHASTNSNTRHSKFFTLIFVHPVNRKKINWAYHKKIFSPILLGIELIG